MTDSPERPVVLIFSKDRPLQLDATIRSLQANGRAPKTLVTRVLWTGSTRDFTVGYGVLSAEHPTIEFHHESNFKADVGRLTRDASHIFFVVDDTLFLRPFSIRQAIDVLESEPACLGFSFRLGRNTVRSFVRDRPQALPAFESIGDGVLTYTWLGSDGDFGYSLEVSSSLFRAADLEPLLVDRHYKNPNRLESALIHSKLEFVEHRPRLACFETSVACSVPANIVQTTHQNRASDDASVQPEALLARYRAGDRLDLTPYGDLVPNAVHQEVEYAFTGSMRRRIGRAARWQWYRVLHLAGRLRRRLRRRRQPVAGGSPH